MSDEAKDGFELYEDALGVQDDGEPAVVAEEEVKPEEEAPAKPEEGEKPEAGKEEEEDEDKPHKKSGSQRAREKAQRLELENQMLREQLAGKKPAEEPKAQKGGAPKEEDFETHDDYLVAKAKHEIRQEDAARARENQARAAKANWDAKVEAGREKFEDFDEVLADAEAPSPLLAPRLIHEKTPVEVIYHLATHPKELKEINALGDPYDVAEALAEIKAKVLAPKEPKPKPVTKAPAPLVPVKGSAAASQSDDGFEVY